MLKLLNNGIHRKLILALALFIPSCSIVNSSFIPEPYLIHTKPKEDYSAIEYFVHRPSREALQIGILSLGGNGFSTFDDLIKEAKRQTANLGGDFVIVEESGVEKEVIQSPGYSNYTASVNASYGSLFGYGNGNANGYSVGPSASTIKRPWSVFSVWVYRPSKFGLNLDENHCVIGFDLNSNAEEIGVKLGDQLLGIDGYDVHDHASVCHIMKIEPGSKVALTLKRGEQKVKYSITALPN